jgi:glycine cleavage system aminomethyltransferase T
VGTITSLAESLELRAPVALALVRREVTPGDTVTVQWEGATTPAVVHDLPLDHFDAEE